MITELEVRQAVPQSAEGTRNDPAALVEAAVALWERATGRLWKYREDYQEVQYGSGGTILLSLWPVETITSVEERRRGSAEWITLNASSWVFIPRRTIERVTGCWGHQVRVTYTGGVKHDGVGAFKTPDDIRRGLVTQCAFMLKRWSDEKVAVKSQGFAGGSSTFFENAAIHPLLQELVDRHQRKI